MELTNYDVVVERAKSLKTRSVAAVAAAANRGVIEATLQARADGVIEPVFVGDVAKIREILREMDLNPTNFNIAEPPTGMNEAETAVALIKSGSANFLMKGMIETSDLMREVVKKENNLRTERAMTHLAFFHFERYHKIFCLTDSGLIPHPDMQKKIDIVHNAVDNFHRLGVETPKIACFCCKEEVDPKMQETLDARALQEMAEDGDFGDCDVVGPISLDIAFSKEIAEAKGFKNPNCGNFDIGLVTDVHGGNSLGKSLIVNAGAVSCGIVVGAKTPIVLSSRGASATEKYLALAMAAVVSAN